MSNATRSWLDGGFDHVPGELASAGSIRPTAPSCVADLGRGLYLLALRSSTIATTASRTIRKPGMPCRARREVGAAVERHPLGVKNAVSGQPPWPVIAWTAAM